MNKLPIALLTLRLSIFTVLLMWTLDKFLRPEHAITVYENFYFISNITETAIYIIAGIEMAILICFLCGVFKRLSYGAVFIFHAVSTISTYQQMLHPFQEINLLFYAAIPMLAACFTLYILRDEDTLITI